MCGIAGIIRWDGQAPSAGDVEAMCDVMVHRGPDDMGLYADGQVALGMRRLSIIDLDTGHQPVHNEDRTLWLVFNGEIYNFKELRRDLEQRGHRFYTTSDTETIVHLHEEYGDAAVEHLRGMFAYALWDTKRRRLLLVRDRLGIKPLYYAPIEGGLAFGSELKTVLEAPGIDRQLNWESVGHLFMFSATPATESIIEGVHKLAPAHRAAIDADGGLTIERYWDVNFAPDHRATEAELVERLRSLLNESVDIHRRSDVPFGVFLSGGLDSTAVLATLSRLSPGQVKTFSIGFKDAAFDELPYARQAASAFHTDHHELVLEPFGWDTFEEIAGFLDEPFGDAAALPTYMLSKLAAEHVKVVLTGDGGDEIFAGYSKYANEQTERRRDYVPAPLRRALGMIGDSMPEGAKGRTFLRHIAMTGSHRYLHGNAGSPEEQARIFQPGVLGRIGTGDPWATALGHLDPRGGSWLSALQYWDLQAYLPLLLLTKVDRMTMAHSIEARPPLLDHRLVEFAARVPSDLLLRGRTTKYLFKQAMRGIVPNEIIDRKKHGFAVPLAQWFRSDLSDFLRDLLLSPTSRQRGIFNPQYLEQQLRLHEGGRDLDDALWMFASFELWCRSVLDARPGLRGAGAGAKRPALVRGTTLSVADGHAG
jgi:asparagine synthase (glutamine-hydrolysing)